MSKTLADMTADERQACVGMWCDNLVSTADNPQPVVLACVQRETCWILHTGIHGERSGFPLESVAPRFDLPRAWTTEGEPPKEKYEFTAQVFMNQHWVFMWSPTSGNSVRGKWHATRKLAEKFSEQWQLDYPIRIVRRRVSPVEVVDD